MPDKPITTPAFPLPDFKFMEAGEMIKDLPPIEDLTARELAIHRRAFQDGQFAGEQGLKRKITHEFQLTMFGHVL